MIHRLSTAAPAYPTLLWIGVGALCLLAALATVPRLAWADASSAPAATVLPSAPAPGPARARARCTTCGVVEAIRRIEPAGTQPAAYEFTVRLRDGSTRVSTEVGTSPGPWLVGDPIMLIAGK